MRNILKQKAAVLLSVAVLWGVLGGVGVVIFSIAGPPSAVAGSHNPCNPCNPCGGGMAVDMKVVLEYSSDIPGVAKVQLARLVMQPGAALENLTIEWEGYCTGTKGVFTVVNHTHGTTGNYAAGGRWNDVLGEVVSLFNHGDVPAEQWIYMLIPE